MAPLASAPHDHSVNAWRPVVTHAPRTRFKARSSARIGVGTAHNPAVGHDSGPSCADPPPGVLTLVGALHPDPLQVTAWAWLSTARQNTVVGQETEVSDPPGSIITGALQADPSKLSAWPALSTATQNVTDAQLIALSVSPGSIAAGALHSLPSYIAARPAASTSTHDATDAHDNTGLHPAASAAAGGGSTTVAADHKSSARAARGAPPTAATTHTTARTRATAAAPGRHQRCPTSKFLNTQHRDSKDRPFTRCSPLRPTLAKAGSQPVTIPLRAAAARDRPAAPTITTPRHALQQPRTWALSYPTIRLTYCSIVPSASAASPRGVIRQSAAAYCPLE